MVDFDVEAIWREVQERQAAREGRIAREREEWMKTMEGCRCVWEVLAGIIPGEPMSDLTRRWALTGREWEGPDRDRLFLERQRAAEEYAQALRDPGAVNWVRLEWLWL